MFWEDPLRCHWDGLTFPQSKLPHNHVSFFPWCFPFSFFVWVLLSLSSSICLHPPASTSWFEFWFPSFLHSARRWMQSTAPYGCWLPVPRGCRWSAVRRRPRSLGPLRWTTNSLPSRSSSALTTSPRLPSNWSPSPLVRRSSDPTKCMGGEERGREDGSMHGWTRRDGKGL